MRKDKVVAFQLRKDGKSYREIQAEINVSRSTLCDWFKNEEWSNHIKHKNNQNNVSLSKERLLKLNEGRSKMFEKKYIQVEIEAEKEFQIFKNDPLFMAGLMIYAGEGDKKSSNISRVSNSEFYLHNIFLKFSEKYLYIQRVNIKMAIIIYPDLDINVCLNKWSEEVNILISNFHKTQIIKGKEKSKKLQYGVGISIISTTVVIKKKILKWLELTSVYGF